MSMSVVGIVSQLKEGMGNEGIGGEHFELIICNICMHMVSFVKQYNTIEIFQTQKPQNDNCICERR